MAFLHCYKCNSKFECQKTHFNHLKNIHSIVNDDEIFVVENVTYLILSKCEVISFESNLCAYHIKIPQKEEYKILKVIDLPNFSVFEALRVNGCNYIVAKHIIL